MPIHTQAERKKRKRRQSKPSPLEQKLTEEVRQASAKTQVGRLKGKGREKALERAKLLRAVRKRRKK